ncbi:disulfide bond formation protein DsbB [Paenibacillus forsythiae]|uniref:Disulfide bond formation protein DsbB n=1 Tax=Paenibacillus forsythiae TaxID=365616 RepID=A0ABU3H2T1_9BACL|nr:disulfide oxidoreductase [Paenibacillus forsythiae]MDT3424771.1 disulfide bond formation protein DsbB [Paenibacillus forsythiae]
MSAFSIFLRRHCLYLAWLVALVATAGSLYLSEVLKYEPCKLCWFQRIFMYPQVFLLGIATYRGDRRVIPYVLPLCAAGGSISLYHYAEQKIPALGSVIPCTVGVPCSKDYLNFFGFITIPLLALTAFTLIFLLLWNGRGSMGEKTEEIGDRTVK